MFDTTGCDFRYAAHTERVARIDRLGWRETTDAAARPRLARIGVLIARVGLRRATIRRPERVATVPAGRGLS